MAQPQSRSTVRAKHMRPEFSVKEGLAFFSSAPKLTGKFRVLEEVGLADRANDVVGELSSGLRRRACFAAALVHRPPLLLLDEPSTNLDEEGARMVHRVIEAQGARGMALIATNDPAEAEMGEVRLDLGRRV